tara:strand:+ start:315 stop:764 length:450 start_codon:yes stop_codon:yes gene_type:complete
MKLISCTGYAENERDNTKCLSEDIINSYNRIMRYANFLKRQLELGMFVPCDLEGNVVSHPIIKNDHLDECDCFSCNKEYAQYIIDEKIYQEAKNRVLFEGFLQLEFKEYKGTWSFYGLGTVIDIPKKGTIEYLTNLDLTLTDNAIKQIR